MCADPGALGQDLEIDAYQVIVEGPGPDVDLIVNLTAEARALTVPPDLVEENTAYQFEVLAKEVSGNQVVTFEKRQLHEVN